MTYEHDGFDEADAHIYAVTKVLTDPEIIQDAFGDFIGSGEGCKLMAIILGSNNDSVRLEAINRLKVQYLTTRYTKIVIDAESNKLIY
jgi:hypothetical protein